jgi:hypothetical protein
MTQSSNPDRQMSTEVDARNRHLAQRAGLDQDLESQVPPRYGRFTVTVLGALLVLLVTSVIWILL